MLQIYRERGAAPHPWGERLSTNLARQKVLQK
jgi:hypothetical protein